jgi:hypothetical protein
MASLDRYSVETARELVHRYYHDDRVEAVCKHYFSTAIKLADSIEPGSWSVTMSEDYIALNSGKLFVFGLIPGKVTFVFDGLGVAGSQRNVLQMWGQIRDFNSVLVPELLLLDVPAADLESAWPDLENLLFSAIEKAAVTASSEAVREGAFAGVR